MDNLYNRIFACSCKYIFLPSIIQYILQMGLRMIMEEKYKYFISYITSAYHFWLDEKK